MIKFRCPHCNQKLGVKEEYAGRRIRCTRCAQPSVVPEAGQVQLEQPAEVPAEPRFGADVQPDAMFSDNLWEGVGESPAVDASEAARQQVIAQARAPRTRVKSAAKPPAGANSSGPSAVASLAAGAGRIPLAIGAAVLFPLAGGVIWGLIARATGFIFCWGAIPVACLAAVGLTMFVQARHVGIGLLAALLGFVGIMEGKLCIARLAVVPEVQKMVDTTLEEMRQDPEQLTEQDVDDMLEQEWPLYAVATVHLMEAGEFDKEFVGQIFKARILDEAPEDMADAVEAADVRVQETMDGWTQEQKRQMIRDKWPTVAAVSAELFMSSNVGGAFTMGLAFVGSFALWDLLFIPLALWSAFKIGSGRD